MMHVTMTNTERVFWIINRGTLHGLSFFNKEVKTMENTLPERVVVTKQLIVDIADAVREVTGTTEPLTIDQMIAAINAL